MGPFVDESHPSVSSLDLDMSFDQLFHQVLRTNLHLT